jgi:hypothetical protein
MIFLVSQVSLSDEARWLELYFGDLGHRHH